MKVSVILCTYNRCRTLATALESVAASRMPDALDWEVLVVDNNSKDQTRRVVEDFINKYAGRFRYFFESHQGKSYALNSGIREAGGEVLAFMDDDVAVEPDWLSELVKPFSDPTCAGTGGRVYLPKDFTPPSWMATDGPHSLVSILALFDLGSVPAPISKPPIGNNMAFRKAIFSQYGGFRTDLGPTPGSEIRHEDTEFGLRVLKAGEKIQYVPSAVVRHAVEECRLKKRYFLAYHYDYGRATIREKGSRPSVGIIPRSLISFSNRLFSRLPQKVWWWLREPDPQKRFFNKCHVWATAGELVEICRRSFGANTQEQDVDVHPGREVRTSITNHP